MNHKPPVDIQALFADGKEIDAALREAARNAMIMHKRMGGSRRRRGGPRGDHLG